VVNLTDMVVRPASAVEPDVVPELIEAVLPDDVRRIATAAAQTAVDRASGEISAHGMLEATADEGPALGFAAPWRWEK
jgi:hypothetical protein